MLYSFDIFDTLVTRITYYPIGLHDVVQEFIRNDSEIPRYVRNNYAGIRSEAEKKARDYSEFVGDEEISLHKIHHIISEYSNYSDNSISYLEKLEIDAESKCVLPITSMIDRVKELINLGKHVILISDMYLSKQTIREMLVGLDSVFEDIPIFVSCDYNRTKAIGSIYAYIHETLGIEYKDWHHTGDNRHSDFLVPQTLGITCELYDRWKEYSWISELRDSCDINTVDAQVVLGVVKYISCGIDSDLTKLGKSFAGIIVEEYSEWIIHRALQDNIEELYFIARDGYVIKKVVDFIIEKNGFNISTKYIYGSRKAWRVKDASARENIIQYFRENVNFNKRIAFVDANGTGVSISLVADLLGEMWNHEIPIYYFSFHRQVENSKCCFFNYCYNASDIIELLCSATHGTTVGYQLQEGKMKPVLAEGTVGENLDEYVKGILVYTDMLLNVKHKLGIEINARRIVKCLVSTKRYSSGMTLQDLWTALNTQTESTIGVPEIDYTIDTLKSPEAQRVIIYGAGIVGKRMFCELNKSQETLISAWTDINYIECMKKGLPVISVNEAIKKEFDYILIAIKNRVAVQSATCILTQLGVDESAIRYIEM